MLDLLSDTQYDIYEETPSRVWRQLRNLIKRMRTGGLTLGDIQCTMPCLSDVSPCNDQISILSSAIQSQYTSIQAELTVTRAKKKTLSLSGKGET